MKKLSSWVTQHEVPFKVLVTGTIVMLLWAGAFKMTSAGAEGIAPLVNHSWLIGWHFRVFGTYLGSDMIGLTEWISAVLLFTGLFRPKAGIIGGAIGVVIFFTTSTMLLSTPGATKHIHGFVYMTDLGLFLFKDVISLGVSFYFISYFGKKAFQK